MNYANIKNCDIANGPGVRVSLFVSGCTHHCKNCFNPETWDFNYGKPFDDEVCESIIKMLSPSFITGLTLLGGEPFEPSNQAALLPFLKKVKELFPQKSVWCYTGYDFERDILPCRLGDKEVTKSMLSHIDYIVDGEFVEELKNISLRFKGSSNQRIIDVRRSLEQNELVRWEEDE